MNNSGRISISSEIEALATAAVNAAFEVHQELGPGLLESAYEAAFSCELDLRGVRHQRQVPVPVHYKGKLIELGFRADVVLDGRLLIELKAVETVLPVHTSQAITYLKVLNLPLGFLINFNEVLIKDGLHRVLNLRHRLP